MSAHKYWYVLYTFYVSTDKKHKGITFFFSLHLLLTETQ